MSELINRIYMKNYPLLVLCFSVSFICAAQVSEKRKQHEIESSKACGGVDSVMAKKGSWKKVEDDLAFPDKTFPRSQYKLVNSRIDSFFSFVKAAIPALNGFEASWSPGIRGDSYIPNGPLPYRFQSFHLTYGCNIPSGKIILGDETGNWVYIFVNKFQWFFKDVESWDIEGDGKMKTIFQLPSKVGQWKGVTVYELKISTHFTSRSVIIGRNGKVPWRSLTQKQYLTGLKNKWQNELKKTPPGLGYEKERKDKLKHINDYLEITNEETLQQLAVIDLKSGIWGFKGKFGDEEAGGYRLVLLTANDKYFDKNLPRYVPQLIQLYWSYGYSSPEQLFKKQFEENFSLEKLKAMIDK
jgi:hypothetical protein